MVSLMAGVKLEGSLKWMGLKSQGPLFPRPLHTDNVVWDC